MGLLNVNINDEVMCVSKSPGIKSLGVFAGILSLGVGAAYYGSDNILMKCTYVFGCFVIAGSCLEDWEECILDKVSRKVTLRRSSFFQKFFKLKKMKDMNVNLSHVIAVRVESAKGERWAQKYNVALLLRTGMPLSVLENSAAHNRSDCDLIAERMRRFLKISHIESVDCMELDDSNYYSDRESSSSDSDVREMANMGRPRETVTQINETR